MTAAGQMDAEEATCAGEELVVTSAGNPQGGVDCRNVENFSIILEDGAVIENSDGAGIFLKGRGNLAITTRSADGYSRVRSNTDTIAGSSPAKDMRFPAIHVVGVYDKPGGKLDIQVTDVDALGEGTDGIRVVNYSGDTTITSTGTIHVGRSKPAFGVLYRNEDAAAAPFTTVVNVNNIISKADAPAVGGPDIAALRIATAGGATVHATGHIHSKGLFSYGVHVKQTNRRDTEAGPIKITVNDITTEGPGSFGIYGDILLKGNAKIDVNVLGRIATSGWGSHGVVLSGNSAEVDVVIAETGSIIVKPTGSWDEWFWSQPDTFAVIASESDATNIVSAFLTNLGSIAGDVSLEGCLAPLFVNRGEFSPYGKIVLRKEDCAPPKTAEPDHISRTTGLLENFGTLSFGRDNEIATVAMTGDLHQVATGTLRFDVDWASQAADMLEIDGLAKLNGRLVVNSLSIPTGTTQEETVLAASDGISGIPDLSVQNSLFLDYSIKKAADPINSGRETLELGVTLNLIPDGLNQNQRNVLAEIHNSRPGNDTIADAFLGMLNLVEIEDLRLRLDGHGNEIAGAAIQSTYHASGRFANLRSSCTARERDANSGRCVWVSGSAHRATRARTWPQRGFGESAAGLAAGVTLSFDDGAVRAGFGLGISESRLSLDSIASATGRNVVAAAGFEAEIGAIEFSLSTTAGATSYNILRQFPVAGAATQSTGKMSNRARGVHGSARWPSQLGNMQIAPTAGFSLVSIRSKPYGETGAGDLSLDVGATKTELTSASIGVEMVYDPIRISGFILKPAIGGAVTRTLKGTTLVESAFQGGAGKFLSTTSLLPTTIDLEAGTEFRSRSGQTRGSAGLQVKFAETGRIYHLGLGGELAYEF